MENRKGNALSERRWSSSEMKFHRGRSMSAAQKYQADLLGGLPEVLAPHPSRPFSSIPSRPESRASRPESRASRPASRADSRPTSRLGTRPEQRQGERPMSGKVRPLSGRVFMRRTTERGWVAKAYPDPPSLTELDIFDDLSTTSSLDSFFDDDFDTCQQDEKLQNLLTCNTLGVESKGQRPDWNAGEVGIPKFHCPRCRDHWYGLNPFPCDEELARLIREGLWYTGEGDAAKVLKNRKSTNRRSAGDEEEFKSLSADSLPSNVSHRMNKRSSLKKQTSRDPFEWKGGVDSTKKKSKKRITFKLDSEDEGSDKGSGTFDNKDHSGQNRASWGDQLHSGLEERSGDTGDRSGLLKSGCSDGVSSMSGVGGSEDHLDSSVNADLFKRSQRNQSGSGGQEEEPKGADTRGRSGGRRLKGGRIKDGGDVLHEGSSSGSSLFASDGKDQLAGERTSRNQKLGNGTHHSGGSGTEGGTRSNESGLGAGSGKWAFQSGSTSHGLRNSGIGSELEEGSGLKDRSGRDGHTSSSQEGSLTSIRSSTQVSKSGDNKSKLGKEDHGKNVRKAVGYMRAVSPSQSDWGDPMHARSYISSTATSSRAGSTSNLLRDEVEEEELTLPPIVPPITNKKPMIDLSDLIGGIQLTRAWTFSYHSSGKYK